MFKKILMGTTAATLSMGILLPTTSAFAASVSEKPSSTVIQKNASTSSEVEAAGVRGAAIKGALQTIKYAVKAGDWVLGMIEEYMSSGAAKYLKNNTTKINSGLDKAIKKIDDSSNYVQSEVRKLIYDGLRAVKVPATYAEDIAENMAAVVSFLAF